MVWNRHKLPYSQMEISEQIGQIAELMKMRRSSQIVGEVEKFSEAIETAQEVLAFMLDENVIKQGRKSERAI